MTSLFKVLDLLDKENLYYTLARTRSDTVQINVTFVGVRVELEVFEDEHFEMSRFVGNEDVESGSLEMVEALIKELI